MKKRVPTRTDLSPEHQPLTERDLAIVLEALTGEKLSGKRDYQSARLNRKRRALNPR